MSIKHSAKISNLKNDEKYQIKKINCLISPKYILLHVLL